MLIGDVARRSGVSTRMLRHYDSLGLVRPTGRTSGGYREYSDEDVRRLFQVEGLRSLGLSLRQIARALQNPTCTPAGLVRDLIRWTEERLDDRERELLDRLRTVAAAAPTGWPDVLRITDSSPGSTHPAPPCASGAPWPLPRRYGSPPSCWPARSSPRLTRMWPARCAGRSGGRTVTPWQP